MARRFKAGNSVYDMQFCGSGEKLSVATMDSQVYLLDIRV